jgi:hypothetical protein
MPPRNLPHDPAPLARHEEAGDVSEIVKAVAERQECIDAFYWARGACCAGCDWWRSLNSSIGECTKSAPVAGGERWAMLGVSGCSLHSGAGHVTTSREHVCGEFKDGFDWSSLPLAYRARVGAP